MKSLFAAALFSVFALGHGSGQEAFSIKLERGGKVGEKRQVSGLVTSKVSMEMTVNGAPTPAPPGSAENKRYKIDGAFEIIAVDDKGNVTELDGTVEKLVSFEADGVAKELLAEGTEVKLKANAAGEVGVTSGGAAVEEEAAAALGEFFDIGGDDELDADSVFGTEEDASRRTTVCFSGAGRSVTR